MAALALHHRPLVRDGLPGQELADDLHRLAQAKTGLVARYPELREAADAGADAEYRALPGDLVERRDRHRGQRGVAGVGIRHARAELDALRAQRAQGQRGVHLPEEALVGQPEVVVAGALGELGDLGQPGGGLRGQQEETGGQRHQPEPARCASTIFSAVMGRLVIRAPTAAAMALATAAGGSMFGGSPTPLAPRGPTQHGRATASALATAAGASMFGGSPAPLAPKRPARPGCSTRMDSTRGTSSVVGIL